MKRLRQVILGLVISLAGFLWLIPTIGQAQTVYDDAGLFTPEQNNQLTTLATALNQQINGQIFIVTTTAVIDDRETFADNFLREKIGNDHNGSVLLIDMNQHNYQISTSGNMIDYLTNSRLKKLLAQTKQQLREGNYYEAAKQYIERATSYVQAGVPGGHTRVDRDTGKVTYYRTLTPLKILLALLVAFVISTVVFFSIKASYQLKRKTYAYPFRDKSSVVLTDQVDHLTNSFITTRHIPKNNHTSDFGGGDDSSTHSSGGGTFGGGGGSF